jgi:hypothetical protein
MTCEPLVDAYVMGENWISPETNCLNNRICLKPRTAKTDETSFLPDRSRFIRCAVRTVLREMGVRCRLHGTDLPGKPGIAVPSRKTTLFVPGCLLHIHSCRYGRLVNVGHAGKVVAGLERKRGV